MITPEKIKHHISHLQEKHDNLDKEIKELEAHHTDSLKIETLKKLKLKLKDEIEGFRKQL
jgi:hypothetical protein